ncbi:restriction endonuclease subunit S [Rufibacter aurantiacus]|uniref:restriction endonuclease subunit S n=1 Tax=Rufibacter aurantiacus TaxID=2817374 RepID=UPI001B3161A3|nr:restriction endonuclease subunit S [Rufibacter aurantiacus]
MEAIAEDVQVAKYVAYKNSDVEWLGEVPAHWEVIKAKYLWKEKIELSQTEEETLLSVSQYLGVNNREVDSRSESLVGYKKVAENDLVINIMLAWLGGLGISPLNGVVSPAYGVYQLLSEADPKFLHYLYRTGTYLDEFARRSRGVVPSRWRMYTDDFGQVLTLLPPKEEQTAIAQFLDRKTAQIDKAIGIKEKQIDLLKERRQVLIHNAVTRGLNPDAPMKDSDVEWIGEIPAHWEVKKIKYVFKQVGGGTPSKDKRDFWDGDIPWVSPKDMKSDYISSTEDYITEKGLYHSTSNIIKSDTLLMVVRSGILQRTIPVAIATVDLTINQDMKAFIPLGPMLSKYFYYYIKGNDRFLRSEWVKQGATVESVEGELLKNDFIPIPPAEEQREIISFIEFSTSKIAVAISSKEKEIEKLKEYKASLINSAVTGKIKVC